jgi:hypothetical protein
MVVGAELARWRRLRWRLRGAWQWPTFAAFVVLDAASLHLLPVSGTGPSPAAALLLAGFLNLAAVGLFAPLAGRWLRRARPDLPRVVANDYAGTALVVSAGLTVVVLGLGHRPQMAAAEHSFRAQSDAVAKYVLGHAPVGYRRNLGRANTWALDDHLYRTCVPGPASTDAMCFYVDTSQSPPRLRRDPNPVPNSLIFGPRGGRPSG